MRTKNVIGVLENLKHDRCGYELIAIEQAIDCVKKIHKLNKWMKQNQKAESEPDLGFNPWQE